MTEVLEYCLTQLLLGPRELVVHQLFTSRVRTGITKEFSRHKFQEQQRSILSCSPEPLFGRGYLWFYELRWSEADEPDQWKLSIVRNESRTPTHREAILLASVTEGQIPFDGTLAHFKATKARMLGKEAKRISGAVHTQLRPAVANVQFTYQGGHNFVTAINPAETVTTIF